MDTELTDLCQYQHHQQQQPKKKSLEVKQQVQEQVKTLSPASPPSSSSSPNHEFSFTISLHSSSSTQQITNNITKTQNHQQQQKHNNSSFAVDLSPADEIFFHGHLLPLHLLSHLPVSPRSSTNSMDSFTLPIKELEDNPKPIKGEDHPSSSSSSIGNSKINIGGSESFSYYHERESKSSTLPSRNKPKSSSFSSIFGWRKGFEVKEKNKRKSSFDVSLQVLKKYARMVRPLLFFKGRKDSGEVHCHRQAHSFSDSSSWRRNRQPEPTIGRRRGGELFSAPASMRTSPSNSGLLLPLPPTTSDSTMEELQSAIQAAIAHCKNSVATQEKIKFQS